MQPEEIKEEPVQQVQPQELQPISYTIGFDESKKSFAFIFSIPGIGDFTIYKTITEMIDYHRNISTLIQKTVCLEPEALDNSNG